jgi:hypothetical protein
MSKESLGVISCEGCNDNAHIKRRANGKKLLYLHCKNCGLDQRSGKILQAKWQAAIDGRASESPELQQSPLKISKNDEWQPEKENEDGKNNSSKSDKDNSGTSIKWLAGIGIGLAILFGIRT